MMQRRNWVLAGGLVALVGGTVRSAVPPGQRRLGVLLFGRAVLWTFLGPELRKALADLGWVEGSNLTVEWRYADDDETRLTALAAALARSGVDAILTRGTPATRALKQATRTVPIITGVGDPVGSGFAETLARPGGNITGISWAQTEKSRKQLELLREMVPRLSRLSLVLDASRQAFASELTASMKSATRESGITARIVFAGNADELRQVLLPVSGTGTDAAYIYGIESVDPGEVVAALLRARLPAMFEHRGYVDAGGLMSYWLDWDNQTQRSAAQIDKVFRGENPAQIPFELPTRSELIINARTAKSLGLTIPKTLLVRADEVIE